MLATLRHLLFRVGPWPRRAAAVACLALAALNAVDAHRPASGTRAASGATVRVAVAARALPVGHVVSARDVAVAAWPRAFVPAGAFRAQAGPVGRRLAGPLARGEPLTPRRLVGRDLTSGLAVGLVAATVALADPHVLDLVHAGDHVDVLATARDGTAGARSGVAAADATVLAAFGNTDVSDTEGTTGGAEVVIATTHDAATRLAGVSSSDVFTIVARSP